MGPQGPQGPQGEAGQNGLRGEDGKDGTDGKDGKDGKDGYSIFTSTVFIRQNEKPNVPEGGNFDDPLPRISIDNGIAWEDGIPSGEEIL